MKRAREILGRNVVYVEELRGLHAALAEILTEAIDISDLLRAQIFFSVILLDALMHDAIVDCFLEMRRDVRAYQSLPKNSKKSAEQLWSASRGIYRVRNERNAWTQYISEAAYYRRGIFDDCRTRRWWEIEAALQAQGFREPTLQLNAIVDRRNRIAHEADVDAAFPAYRVPLAKNNADEALRFVRALSQEILRVAEL